MRDIEEATVQLTVPCDSKYLGLVRLLVSSVAADANFSYDAIEDLRIVADELTNLAMTAAAPGTVVRIGVFPESKHFVFRGSAVLPSSNETEPPVELDVLAAKIVASLVEHFKIETLNGRLEVSFSVRLPSEPTDG
jgi:serine/threonine-protein kinase RsbW